MRKLVSILFLLQATSLALVAQSVSINASSIRIGDILEEITKQTGLHFSYNSQTISVDQQISFSVRNESLEKTLKRLSRKINIAYSLIENQIVLYLPEEASIEKEKYFTLSGFITDRASGETLIGATVAIKGTAQGAITNAFGYYSLPLKAGQYTLHYSYVGYEKEEIQLGLNGSEKKDLSLAPTSIDLPDVIVEQSTTKILDKATLEQMVFRPEDLGNMPEFGGESGLVKGLQSLPGIKMHSDGSAFFYTRGGERDQNLIIIDDAPIYNPSHLFGFYSMVIPDFAKQIDVYKSDVPTNLGDRLSSIVSIRTKDGNLNKFEFSGALNPLINRFSLEAPVVKEKGSIFASFRRSNFEWLYRRAAPRADLGFGDFHFKWNHKLNNKNRLYFTTIIGVDNFTNRTEVAGNAGIRWANFAATLRWNHLFGPKLFSNTTIYTGNYDYQLFFAPNYWRSGLGTLSLKSDFTHYARQDYTSKFGWELQGFFVNPGSVSLDTTIAILPTIKPNYARKTVLYYQGIFDLNKKMQLNAGLRLINWANVGPATYYSYNPQYEVTDTVAVGEGIYKRYHHLDPRISLQYEIDSTSKVKVSVGSYHQYLQLISNSVSPFTSLEVWLPANQYIKPQSATQLSLNYVKYFQQAKVEFNTAFYYKAFNHQIDYQDHPTILLNPLVEGELRFGTMESYGMELLLKKQIGRLSGWMSYTLSRTLRQTDGLNEGRPYAAFQDRPHDFSLLLNYRLARRVLFSAYWTAYSGSTFSSPSGFYQFNGQTVPVFAEKNNDRLPAYRRFDFAFKFVLNKKEESRYQHSLTFSVYNALAHKNIVAVNFNKIPVEGGRPVVKADLLSEQALTASQIDLIRFMPSLTYKFRR
ncbi:MAG: carboxypeptidase-like regulatory domain-containing protein [Saprospiraceae bacterium]